ncbi:MAG: hypothetical protein ACREV0_10485 [Burkholderiales bacterium]
MSNRTFVIRIKKNFGARAVQALISQINAWKGGVLLLTDGGYTIVANLDDSKQEFVRAMPQVALIGGVQIKPRELKRSQVDPSGRPISKQPSQQGG